MRLTLSAVVLALALGAGAALAQPAPDSPQARALAKEAAALKQFPPPGRLVDIGGRRLHILCKDGPKKGGPTAIIEVGAVASSLYYWAAQDAVARVARVCAYDRAGQGWSDPPAAYPRSLEARADDLHALLKAGKVKGPYIVVAHSAGGLIGRIYAKKYPKGLAGLVLVESSEEGFNGSAENVQRVTGAAKMIAMGVAAAQNNIDIPQFRVPNAPPEQAAVLRASVYRAGQDDMEAMAQLPQEVARMGGLGPLGDLPLVVVTRGKPEAGFDNAGLRAAHERLAALSSRSALIVAEKSGHNVHADQPEIYGEAVARVLALRK